MPNDKVPLSLFKIFKTIVKQLPTRRRVQFGVFFAITLVVALLETVALGAIAFFASAVSAPEAVLNSKYIVTIREIFKIDFLNTTAGLIITLSVIVVLLVTIKNSFQALVTYWVSYFSALLEVFWGEKLLNGFLHLPYKWHLTRNTADLVLAVQWRLYLGRNFITPCLQILNDTLIVSFMLIALLIVQPLISLLVIVVLGGTGFLIFTYVRHKLDKVATLCTIYDQSINKQVTKAIHGIKDVKISAQESAFLNNFKQEAYPYAKIFGLQQFLSRTPALALEATGFMMLTVSICLMLFWLEASPVVVTGTIALLAVTAWRVLPAITRILASITMIRNALPYIKTELDYLEIIDRHAADYSPGTPEKQEQVSFEKNITFTEVCFGYQNKAVEVIKNANFTIKKGQTVGIIGPSGAGKSTLVDILIGLLPPTGGQVLIDGKNLNTGLRAAWIQKVGYVPQSPYIYDGTLAENVAFGYQDDKIDRNRVLAVCNMAAMQDFMGDLPNGIDTEIGERGVRLSGGQRQRVAVARALYLNPQVMIFDEATSSLDTKSEKAIQDTIYSLKGKQTLIIIAHRLSTVKECDFLIWIEKGSIKMIGSPQAVLAEYEGKEKTGGNI